MCGLVGMAGNISRHDIETTFRDMLDVSQLRGRDSTGVIRVLPNNRGYDWAKEVGTPNFLVDTRRYESRILGNSSAVIGHTRAKTVGEVNRRSAHPFDYPEQGICGVHNGTLRNHYKLKGYEAGMVDSEVLYAHLAQTNPQDTFSEVEGAFACVWWNDNDKTLNFIRNEERTLYFAYSEDRRTLYWASEMWMFGAVSRKKKLYADKETNQAIYPLEPHMLYSLRINSTATGKESTLVFRPLERINPKPKVAPAWSHGYHGASLDDWVDQGDGSYMRIVGGKSNSNNDAGQGGPVPDPFHKANPTGTQETTAGKTESKANLPARIEASPSLNSPSTSPKEEDGSLNDDLPDFLKSETSWLHREKKPLENAKGNSSPSSTKHSTKTLTLPLSGGSTSKTTTGSQTPQNGEPSPRTSAVVPLFGSRTQGVNFKSSTTLSSGKTPPAPVSFRMVAGLFFVTDNPSGTEYEASQLLKRAGYTCSFCQVPLNLHTDIGSILNDRAVLCRDCTHESSNTFDIIKAKNNGHRFKHV